MAEVDCKLFTRSDDSAVVRLYDEASGELFAACPLPASGPVASVRPLCNARVPHARACALTRHAR
jgi:hypothetical protein